MNEPEAVAPWSGEAIREEPTGPSHVSLRVAGVALIAHGLAHVVGALGMWGVRTGGGRLPEGLLLDPSGAAAVVMGALWCLAVVMFVMAGAGLLRARTSSLVLPAAAGYSLVLCVLAMPTAVVGLAVDVLVVAGVVVAALRRRERA